MRKLTLLFLIGVAAIVFVSAGHAQEPSPSSSARIGTFDSRVIAIAFYRSAMSQEHFRGLRTELEEAKASGDEWRVKVLEAYGPALQHRMHQQGVSTASVREIMEKISDALAELAQEAGVSVIVSKWEVTYKSPAADLVDLTPQLVALFDPSEETLKIVENMNTIDPEEILKSINASLKSRKLYPTGHPAISTPVKKACELLGAALQQKRSIAVGLVHEAIVFENDPIENSDKLYPDLIEYMTDKNADVILFEKGFSEKELSNLFDILSGAQLQGNELQKELHA